MEKKLISDICENLYRKCLEEIPQFKEGKIYWILNGSVLCNILGNVKKIDDELVSPELKQLFKDFVRIPKGDIDICYRPVRPYKFDLNSNEARKFYEISKEQRTYNFVDSNDELDDDIIITLSCYETENGLRFYAKKPQYIFLYKFRELVSENIDEIINANLELINLKNKNIINDTIKLFAISKYFYGYENTKNMVIDNLYLISNKLMKLRVNNEQDYYNIIDKAFVIINQKSRIK